MTTASTDANEERRDDLRLEGASAEQLARLLTLAVRFERFREELKASPDKAARRVGIVLTAAQADILKKYDGVRKFAEMREALQKNCKVVNIMVMSTITLGDVRRAAV